MQRGEEWGGKKRFCMTLFSQRLFPTLSMPRGVTVEAGYLPCAITTFKGLIFNTQHIITVGCGKSTSAKRCLFSCCTNYLSVAGVSQKSQTIWGTKQVLSMRSWKKKSYYIKTSSHDLSFTFKISSKRPFKRGEQKGLPGFIRLPRPFENF